MDRLNFYYLQRVLESEMDLTQANALAALKRARADCGIVGVHANGAVTPNAPPDLHVLVSGPGLASDPVGERIYWAVQQTVDCSQDHLGNSTAVSLAGKERWISVIAEYDETLADPVTDGTGAIVYTRIYESFNLYVEMAAEQALGTNLKPALPSDGVLLADIKLVFAQVQILAGNIDLTRRQDLVREAGAIIPSFVYGTHGAAIAALFGYVDALSSGGGVAFALDPAGTKWRDASTIAAANVNAAITEIVADLYAFAGAGRVGSKSHATAGHFCDLADTSIEANLNAIADAVDGHIGGGAPAHPDTAVTSAAQAGAPEAFAGGSVRDFLTQLLAHVNARTERATAETVSAAWRFANGLAVPSRTAARDVNNPRCDNKLFARCLQGGSSPPYSSAARLAAGLYGDGFGWASPLGLANERAIGGASALQDVCVAFSGGNRRIFFFDDTAFAVGWFDAEDPTVFGTFNLAPLFTAPPTGPWSIQSVCTDGTNLFISVADMGGLHIHQIAACDQTGAALPAWGGSTVLPGNGLSPLALSHTDKIIVAKVDAAGLATRIVCANSWQTCASGLSLTTINAATGAILASGDGSAGGYGVPADWYPSGGLCTDGTHVYATACDPSGAPPTMTGSGFYHADIENPAAFVAMAGLPANVSASRSQCIVCDGTVLWYIDLLGLLATYELRSEALVLHFGGAGLGGAARFAVTDGLNLWVEVIEPADENVVLLQIPCCELQSTTAMDLAAHVRLRASMTLTAEAAIPITDNQAGRLCFDGDGVWCILSNVGGTVASGIARRLPRAGLR
jgi:hypothetical protein